MTKVFSLDIDSQYGCGFEIITFAFDSHVADIQREDT